MPETTIHRSHAHGTLRHQFVSKSSAEDSTTRSSYQVTLAEIAVRELESEYPSLYEGTEYTGETSFKDGFDTCTGSRPLFKHFHWQNILEGSYFVLMD